MIDATPVEVEGAAPEEVVTSEHLVTWVINTVSATFTCGITGITHDRTVNTIECTDTDAIEQRLSEVAHGVHNKILVGTIT
jgi:hypothetical protein